MKRRISRVRRGLSVTLTLAALCSLLAVPALARETDVFPLQPQAVPDGASTAWQQKDPDVLLEEIKVLLDNGNLPEAEQLLRQIETDNAFASLSYYRQPEQYEQAKRHWSAAFDQAARMVAQAKHSPAYTQTQLELLAQEDALVEEYYRRMDAIDQDYTVEYQGTTYCESSLAQARSDGTLTEEEYLSLYEPIVSAINVDMGELYIQLVGVRNQFAQSLGYGNYSDYLFAEVYHRETSTVQAEALCLEALDLFGPLLYRLQWLGYWDPDMDYDALQARAGGLSAKELSDQLLPRLEEVSEELADLYRQMEADDLLVVGTERDPVSQTNTLPLPSYNTAAISLPASEADLSSMLFQFGYAAYLSLAQDSGQGYDLAEAACYGINALYLPVMERLVGAELASTARLEDLIVLCQGLMDGVRGSAFELQVYREGNMTLEELNQLFSKLTIDGGFHTVFPGKTYGWYQHEHLFALPGFYYGRFVGAVSAMELLLLAQEDWTGAADRYLALISQPGTVSYESALRTAGLTDIRTSGTLRSLADRINEYYYTEVCGVSPVSDVPRDSWFYDGVMSSMAFALMDGTGADTFSPNAPLAGEVMDRVLDEFLGPQEDWELAEEGNLTREQLAYLMYFVAGEWEEDTSARADLSCYTDADQISDWGVESMSWAVAEGIITGTSASTLEPGAAATRAQAAAILLRFLTVMY